jgi:hypothetical protein
VRDRDSKITEELDTTELQRLAKATARDSVSAVATAARQVEYRPTTRIHKDDLLGLVTRSARAPTDPGDVQIEIYDPERTKSERKTQRQRAKLFQLLLRAKQEAIPLSPSEIVDLDDEAAERLFLERAAKGSGVGPMPAPIASFGKVAIIEPAPPAPEPAPRVTMISHTSLIDYGLVIAVAVTIVGLLALIVMLA